MKKFGKIDILVNNAGGFPRRVPVANMEDALWIEITDLNARSVFYCSRATIPHMTRNNYGRIVNICSIAAFTGGGIWKYRVNLGSLLDMQRTICSIPLYGLRSARDSRLSATGGD